MSKSIDVNKIVNVLGIFRTVHPEIPTQLILVFLELAKAGKKGLTTTDIEKRVGISQSASSRHCRMLTDMTVRGRSGFKLCTYYQDPIDNRVRYYALNKKGELLYKEVLRAMS